MEVINVCEKDKEGENNNYYVLFKTSSWIK